ncbi:splicing factor, suppressor of white-apricot-like [Quillaja saponaria]|uniref:Splicing factor, suppressor of white-apricot-like n=1 Tax=Quillaja saponaria TaxID=32244 RepID=A0AAD7PPT8_QUISA|nr:splicing factor, suppressor of white-apricot-like [Quillaja saponaria]
MDLEVVGRHALLFDDDASAAFVNSAEALVEWNSLSIDRYDVRHLLPGPPPPRLKRRPIHHTDASSSLEADLDHERYLDLPSSSSDEQEQDNNLDSETVGGYRAVAFSYGNSDGSIEQKNNDGETVFSPSFPVPESLLQNLPPNEKVHQIIARTAMFVSKHGGQSEIVLRVKQGDNPTFGFLMPDHHLHLYFRFLVDHQELLKPETNGNSSVEEDKAQGHDQIGGALSLLGSVYGSGEDEEGVTQDAPENDTEKVVDAFKASACHDLQQKVSSVNVVKNDGGLSKKSLSSLKEKIPLVKRNQAISTVQGGTTGRMKKGDTSDSVSAFAVKSQTSLTSTDKIDFPILEPPSEMKRVVDKIVEFILKNGKEFEVVLVEQDRKHGRFPFLLPSNQYHPYYLKVLQKTQELPGKGFLSDKEDSVARVVEKKIALSKESDNLSFGSAGSELPYDYERKEKFKMVLGKSKKDGQDLTSRDIQPLTMDAAAAAAILQAATKGIKNPCLENFHKVSLNGNGPRSDGGLSSSYGSLHSSQQQTSIQKPKQNAEPNVSVPVAKAIAETAAIVAASEADSSEACLTREQKLKAERLKRAKMFAAMIKSSAAPLTTEPLHSLSVEPPGSGISVSGVEAVNIMGKEREGSSVPADIDNSDKNQKSEERTFEYNERRSKRKYRSRSGRHEEEEEEKEDEEGQEDKRIHKRSRKKHRSKRSSHHSRDRHRHRRRHSSSKDKDSPYGTKHDSSSDEEHRHSRRHSKYGSDGKHHYSRHWHRENNSSDDEHPRQSKTTKHSSISRSEREADVEEGEIIVKSDQSKASEAEGASREASVELSKAYQGRATSQPAETTEVSDDLRAKIRAMLMATL